MSDSPITKLAEATAPAATAPAAGPRSSASSFGGSAADARLAGPGSDLVRDADIAQWFEQVERQFGLVRDEMLAASARTDDSITGIQDAVSTCAAQGTHLNIVLQQVVANQAAQGDASRVGGDARERLLQTSQLVDEAALWRTLGPPRHWILRGRIPSCSRRFSGRHSTLCGGVGQRHGSGGRLATLD